VIGSPFPPSYYLVLGAICGAAGFRLGWRWKNRFVLPITQAIFGWVAFAAGWQAHGPEWAAAVVGAWAGGSTLVSLFTFTGASAEIDRVVLRARPYRESMLDWLKSGKGPESRPLATLLSHGRELALYLAAAVATANFLSIALGAVLLNYMNAYVATLLRAARRKLVVAALAWNLWSVLRVAAYVVLGTAAADVLGRFVGLPPADEGMRTLWLWGGIGAVVDLLLKLALSRPCGRALAGAVDLVAAERGTRPAPPSFRMGLSDPG
jgi:hypothetical protein